MIIKTYLSLLFLCFILASASYQKDEVQLWKTLEWTIKNSTYTGNPFDVEAIATFTHAASGETIKTALFYEGETSWAFRFTPTKTGEWQYETASSDEDLNGISGAITVNENTDPEAHGFIKNFGSKWGWQGTEEAFVPQYVMGKNLEYYYDFEAGKVREDLIEEDIQEFMIGHGFTGFHLNGKAQWFELGAEEDDEVGKNPDPRTYDVMEAIIRKVHEQGGACHIWMWGADGKNDDKGGPGGIIGGHMNQTDKRNLRYLAARLGPLPGWSMGYGFDTENGWATVEQLNSWKSFLETHMGWDHFLGARVGYDDKGQWALIPMPPKPPLDEKNNAPIGDDFISWAGGDYTGYTSYRPMYKRYREAITHYPQKPSFEEDRFRLRDRPNWTYKDYNEERTRQGMWNSAMAGGVANIWANLLPEENHGGSQPYDIDTIHIKHQIKTYATFFENRFLKEMEAYQTGEAKVLSIPDGSKAVIYQEDTEQIEINLKASPGKINAVAVDTKKAYKEISLGKIKGKDYTWKAPYKSDWAIAVGNFDK